MKLKLRVKRTILFAITFILTGIFRFFILFFKFKALVNCIAIEKGEYDENMVLSPSDIGKSREIKRSVEYISKHTPWESLCLVRALTGMTILKLFGIHSVLFLGLSKDKSKGLEAHAWLNVGKYTLIGGEQMNGFNIINWYVSKDK